MNKQRLGIKVLYYYLLNKVVLGVVFLIVSFILLSYKQNIASVLSKIISVDYAILIMSYILMAMFTISVLIIALSLLLSWIKYISCDFVLDENALNIRRGFFNKKEVSIPYRQVQNINIEQSFRYKMMGLSRLIILTDGDREDNQMNHDGVFDVIDHEFAKNIRDFILQRTNTKIPDTLN